MQLRVLIILYCFLVAPVSGLAEDISFATDSLAIKTQNGQVHFTVEVALSDKQQQLGLMFRKSLPEKHGMIFIFPTARQISFWMKNTLIPLDMLFIDNNGFITKITVNATPESTENIPSEGSVRAVIELAGGSAELYHIAKGDKVIYPIFQ